MFLANAKNIEKHRADWPFEIQRGPKLRPKSAKWRQKGATSGPNGAQDPSKGAKRNSYTLRAARRPRVVSPCIFDPPAHQETPFCRPYFIEIPWVGPHPQPHWGPHAHPTPTPPPHPTPHPTLRDHGAMGPLGAIPKLFRVVGGAKMVPLLLGPYFEGTLTSTAPLGAGGGEGGSKSLL